MTSISSTFNSFASHQRWLVVLWFWIAASLDAEQREDKTKKRSISRRIEEQQKVTPAPLRVAGFG